MSQQDVDLTFRVIDAFNRRDLDAFLALMDREVEFTPYEVWSREAILTKAMPESEAGGKRPSRSSPI